MAYSTTIALRHLRAKKRATVSTITIVSVVGVALGVAALLAVLSITIGFENTFREKVLGVNAHVLVLKYGRNFHEYEDVVKQTSAYPEVAGAAPFVITEMMLARGDRLAGVLVKGVRPRQVGKVLSLGDQIIAGDLADLRETPREVNEDEVEVGDEWRWLLRGEVPKKKQGSGLHTPAWDEDEASKKTPRVKKERLASPSEVEALFDDVEELPSLPDDSEWESELAAKPAGLADSQLPGMVVGKTLAEDLGIEVGTRVRLISPLTGLGLSLFDSDGPTTKSSDFRVVAIFEAGFQEYDSRLVYTDLAEAQRFYDEADIVTGVEIRMHDLSQSKAMARRIESELGGAFHTLDWSELNLSLFTALETQKIALTLVIATITFVAAFNVIATLIMVVLERKREIAILKAMGATERTILMVFATQGTIVGAIGTLLGLLVGGGLVFYLRSVHFPLDSKVYLIDHLPVAILPSSFAITALVALTICTLAAIPPSWWAARMLPVEGLRYE